MSSMPDDILSTTTAAPPTVEELQQSVGVPELPPQDRNLELFRQGLSSGLYRMRPEDNPGIDRKDMERIVKKTMQAQEAMQNKKLSLRVGFKMDAMPLTPILPLPKAYDMQQRELSKKLMEKARSEPGLYQRGVRRPFWNTGWNVGVVARMDG